MVTAIGAATGEEIPFRLFFISFWAWLLGKVILHGRRLTIVYWVVSVVAALAFGAAHLPAFVVIPEVSAISRLSPFLLLEVFLLNGLMSIFAAYYFNKYGFLAPVGIHFWTGIVWHVPSGLL